MRIQFIVLALLFIVSSCSSLKKTPPESDSNINEKIVDLEGILNRAEEKATPDGKAILSTGRMMIKKKRVIRGSCWDYANAVYNKAHFPASERITPLKSKMKGPYADVSEIRPGDWLYFINHSFKEIDHSGIFVEWTDFERKRAVLLSYVGGRRKTPGNYKIYNLDNVYYIIRPK